MSLDSRSSKKHKKQSSSSHNIIIGVKRLEIACGKSRIQLIKSVVNVSAKKALQGHGQRIVEEEKKCARENIFSLDICILIEHKNDVLMSLLCDYFEMDVFEICENDTWRRKCEMSLVNLRMDSFQSQN